MLGALWLLPVVFAFWSAFHPAEFSTSFKLFAPLTLDIEHSLITYYDKNYSIDPIGEAAQELIIDGGLENWVKKNL